MGQGWHGEWDKDTGQLADDRFEGQLHGTKGSCQGLLRYWLPGERSFISPFILSHISFVEQERARNPGGEKDFDSHVSTCVLCSFWWMQIDSEDFTARKALRGNVAPPTFDPLLLVWKLRPREGRWPAQGE